MSHYLGIDVAGASNTWFTSLSRDDDGLRLAVPPHVAPLTEIVAHTDEHDVLAAAIDAQLSMAISDNNGFRSADYQLRDILPDHFQNWVASINSLMAVPVRGRQLADSLSPTVATIIETHPRATLYFGCPLTYEDSIANYKKGPNAPDCVAHLWEYWAECFGIIDPLGNLSDGALDAVVCATVAYLCHNEPDRLFRLRHTATDRNGHGPFYVLHPDRRPDNGK